MKANKDWIKLHRKLKKHPIYKNAEHLRIFISLLLDAAWGNYTVKLDGKDYRLQRGQLIIKKEDLAEELEKDKRTISRYLDALVKKYDVIQIVRIGRKYAITIKNYEIYQ